MASSIPLNGYLYIAYGSQHVQEAVDSLASLRKVDSTAHVTVVSDRDIPGFDRVIRKPSFRSGFAGKVDNLTNEYYKNTFFVDTDTHFCEDCSGLFQLLGYFDLCAVVDPAEVDVFLPGLTAYNTGVMLFGPKTRELFPLFRSYYNNEELLEATLKGHPARKCKTDQPSFTLAIRDSIVRVHSLPNVWNARYRFNTSFMGKVKLIHGPTTDFISLEKQMNNATGNRVWEGLR